MTTTRCLRLNALTSNYTELWERQYQSEFNTISSCFERPYKISYEYLSGQWDDNVPIVVDLARRDTQIEIDVLVAISLGMSLQQLKDVYMISFPVLNKYENDTWYGANGRIAFSAKNLGNLVYKRTEFESEIKKAKAGEKFYRTITDETFPDGPTERIIEYVAPFECYNREKDYVTAWKFFEEKYKE